MRAEEVPRQAEAKIGAMARKASTNKGPRPPQGARMRALREAAGLTQGEIAKALGVPQSNIAHWEWSNKPPRADLLPLYAKVLGVTIDEIIETGRSNRHRPEPRPGPIGQLQRTFDAIRKLPRKQQRKIIETVTALIEQYHRKSA